MIDVIIPAYNEGKRIEATVAAYLNFFVRADVKIIVVLNGCTDNSRQVVEKMQKQFPRRVEILEITQASKGAAILAGWQTAQAEVVGFVDADGATSPAEFNKLIQALDCHDGVIASRFMPESKIFQRQSIWRTIMSHLFKASVKILFNLPYLDTQCGAKIFRKEMVSRVMPQIRAINMNFDVDLLWRLHRVSADIVEVPTIWYDQPGSAALGTKKQFFAQGIKMFISLLRLRFIIK